VDLKFAVMYGNDRWTAELLSAGVKAGGEIGGAGS